MIFDICFTLLFILIGYIFPLIVLPNKNKSDVKSLRIIFLVHLIFGVAFFFYTNNGGGDAYQYWIIAKNMSNQDFWKYLYEAKGTFFMYSLNYFPSHVLDMSFFANTMLYTLLGYIGVVFFYLIALETIPFNSRYKGYKLFPLLFYMPNLHFWSSGIGKDTLLFVCVAFFVYSMLNINKRLFYLIFSLIISYLLRPHITLFLLISFAMAFLFESRASGIKRISLMVILVVGSALILPTVMQFAKIEDASVGGFNKFSASKAEALSGGNTGSSIDISAYPFPLKVLTFLYRPFFFDIRGVPAVLASFENLVLLLLTFRIFKQKSFETFKAAPFVIKGLLFFLLIGTLAFSQSLGNLGIMIRMRNMFLPGMLIYILWSFSYQRELREKLRVKRLQQHHSLNILPTHV